MRSLGFFSLTFLWTLVLSLTFTSSQSEQNVTNTNTILVDFTSHLNVDNKTHLILSIKELLSRGSEILFETIKLPLHSVTFLVPDSWDTNEWEGIFDSERNATHYEKSFNANISIVSSTPFNVPVATQYQGCGLPGRRVVIPSNFSYEYENFIEGAKWFAKEWIKYKYGVFDENGFPDDPMFPEYYQIPGEENIKITDCANVPVNYAYQKTDGQKCNLTVNSSTGLPIPSSKCKVEILPNFNNEVRSSFLDGKINNLVNVNEICDEDHFMHDKKSPNKQNLFCHGRSVSEIIKQHSDFKAKGFLQMSNNSEPKFIVAKKQNLKIVIAVQDTLSMSKYMDFIHGAIKSIVFALPNGSQYNIIKFTDNVTYHSSFTFTAIERYYYLQLRFETEVERSKIAVRNAMDTAIEVIKPSGELQAGILVIITSGEPPHLGSSLKEKLGHLCLLVITVGNETAKMWNDFFQNNSLSRTCKKIVDIETNDFLAFKDAVHAMNSIIEQETENIHFLVKAKTLSSEMPLSFVTSVNSKIFDILVTDIKGSMRLSDFKLLQDKNASIYSLNPAHIEEHELIIIRVKNNEISKWKLEFEKPNTNLTVQVVSRNPNEYILPKVNVWVETENYDDDTYEGPVILYAELVTGLYPIINGAITATITSPDGRKIHPIDLYDKGFGDPDITKDDGIYSRYFTRLSEKGKYIVEIRANDNNGLAVIGLKSDFCCGSVINYTSLKYTGMFSITTKTTFNITKEKPAVGYEPSQIRDLKVSLTAKPFAYTFSWTASGNEKDFGTAKLYELKVFNTQEDAYNFVNEIFTKRFDENYLPAKNLHGSVQYIQMDMSEIPVNNSRLYYIALCSKNENNLESKVSNVVNIFISDQQPTAESNISGTIIGLVICVLVFIGFVSVFIFYYAKKRRNSRH